MHPPAEFEQSKVFKAIFLLLNFFCFSNNFEKLYFFLNSASQFLEQFYHNRDLNIFWKLYGKDFVHRDDIDKVRATSNRTCSGSV